MESAAVKSDASQPTSEASRPNARNIGGPGDPMRGLSVQFLSGQFLTLMCADKNHNLTVAAAEPRIRELSSGICPRDGQEGCAYADVAPDPNAGTARHMLSYSWGYKLHEVASVLAAYCQSHSLLPSHVRVWICCVCINQHRVKEAQAKGTTVSFDEFKKEFGERVRHVDHILAMMSPWHNPGYVQRVWCIFEFFTATNCNKDLVILMPENEEKVFYSSVLAGDQQLVFNVLSNIRIQHAQASVEADKANILKVIDEHATDYNTSPAIAALNCAVCKKMQTWFVQVAVHYLEERQNTDQPVQLEAYNAVGTLLVEVVADYSRACAVLGAAIQRSERQSGCVAMADVLRIVGTSHGLMGDGEAAMRHYEESKAMFEAIGAINHCCYAKLLKNMGSRHRAMMDHVAAMDYYMQSKAVFEDACAIHDPDYAGLLRNMGTLSGIASFDKANVYFEESKAALLASDNVNNPAYARLLRSIGVNYSFNGHSDLALKSYMQSKVAFEAIGITCDPDYGVLLGDVGVEYSKQGDRELAAFYFNAAKTVFQEASITVHPAYARLLERIREYRVSESTAGSVKRSHLSSSSHDDIPFAEKREHNG